MNYARMSLLTPELVRVRDIEGTHPFKYTITVVIPISGQLIIGLEDDRPTWRNYLPFDSVQIMNQDAVDIDVCLNQRDDEIVRVPSGVIQKSYGTSGIWSLKVVNLSATTATVANKITLTFERQGMTTDNLSKKIATGLFGKILGVR